LLFFAIAADSQVAAENYSQAVVAYFGGWNIISNMESRAKKQIFIGSIVILVILIMAFAIDFFYFREAPTCADNKKNQGEEGIDCGGPCEACDVVNLKDIQALWVKALPTTGNNYDLAARIKNPNQNHGSSAIDYEFKVYDLNNKLIGSRAGIGFIMPREEKYLIELRVSAGGQAAKVTLSIIETKWQKTTKYEDIRLSVFDKKYQVIDIDNISSEVSGIIKNSSYFDLANVKINVALTDEKGELIAVNLVELADLVAGQERYFSAPWFFRFVGSVFSIDIEPTANVF
jgi:hypothetical protein